MFQIELHENSNLARQIALVAHNGQMRGTEPYINHPLRVAEACNTIWYDPYAIVGAILHDVIEDSPYTAETLLLVGIDPDVVDVVELMTRKPNVSREDYIQTLIDSDNVHALRVKLMDAIDNSTWTYANELRFGEKHWQTSRIYYRELACKLWQIYLDRHTDAHAPDEDFDFFGRVVYHWNVLDEISIALMRGEAIADELIDRRMLDVISDINSPRADSWDLDAIKNELYKESV